MNGRRYSTLLVIAALAAGSPARAQQLEIAPFAAYRFGGSLENAVTADQYNLGAAFAYGGIVEVRLSGMNRLTVLYSRQETDADTLGGTIPITLQYIQVGGTRDMTRTGAARPFVTGALGVGIADAPGTGVGTQTKFGLSAILGVKTPSTSRVVVRAEARGYLTFVGEQAAAGTCGGGGCQIAFATGTLLQGEVALGLGFRF
jgi:opacity protein-like surface antigen